ncbi:MAG: aminotransferase class I/II-fold pyridoxal phosphate-dependent enzyme [Phycisphaeraceae bacterium]|nr:aminotransferase class I/II-fold pyridoxal phosphate-dependent enzyme [Phycisphaeraceae bacterium]
MNRLLADRARAIDASGIRRVFELGAKLKNPCNLSIGQPDFPAPDAVKRAAIHAISEDRNCYTLTQGVPELRSRIERTLADDLGWDLEPGSGASVLVTSGTSGALLLACFALLGPGDEIIIPDPWFVLYPHLATLCGAKAVVCDTHPDGRMTAERVEPLITERTKIVLFNSPANPTGVVATRDECADLLDLCRRRGVLLISDEIYDEFCYSESRTDRFAGDAARDCCPSPARFEAAQHDVLVVRGFGKTYGVTGWRMGYAAGPTALVEQMAKFQQYTFVCAPAPLQWGCLAALDVDMAEHVSEYEARRNLVVDRLREVTQLPFPGGAFYAFPRVPERLASSGSRFVERAIERSVLVIPGSVFSSRDDHFRLGFATSREQLERGLDAIVELLRN